MYSRLCVCPYPYIHPSVRRLSVRKLCNYIGYFATGFLLHRLQSSFIHFVQILPAGNIPQKHLYFLTGSLTLLLIVIKGIQAPSFDSRFVKVDPGDDVTGNVVENHLFITSDECIVRYVETSRYFLYFSILAGENPDIIWISSFLWIYFVISRAKDDSIKFFAIGVLYKHTLRIMPIFASEALLRENKISSNKMSNTLLSELTGHLLVRQRLKVPHIVMPYSLPLNDQSPKVKWCMSRSLKMSSTC